MMMRITINVAIGGVGRSGSLGQGCTPRYLSANSITILLTPPAWEVARSANKSYFINNAVNLVIRSYFINKKYC